MTIPFVIGHIESLLRFRPFASLTVEDIDRLLVE